MKEHHDDFVMNWEKKPVIKWATVHPYPPSNQFLKKKVKKARHWCLNFFSVMGPPKLHANTSAQVDRNIRRLKNYCSHLSNAAGYGYILRVPIQWNRYAHVSQPNT